MPTSRLPPARTERLLGIVRWLLPLALAVVAIVIEWSEHVAISEEEITPAFVGEVILFALIGPIAVALTLRWMVGIIAGYRATAMQLETMNRSLEAMVADRTRHLEATTAQLAEANRDLRRLDQMKSEFVSLVSHQLRAPLTNINGALELVRQDAARLPASSQRTLQILTSESERLSRLIQTILDVNRIESGRLNPRLGPVAVEPIVARTCAALAEGAPDRTIRRSIATGLPPAWGDELLLEEVLRNLLENALRYSGPASSVEVIAERHDDEIRVSIADHGPGIPTDDQARIFESFHRLGDAEATPAGSGLGLYFAQRLMVAQGGRIAVESPIWSDSDAPGSRFTVALPMAAEEPEDRERSDAAEAPG